MILMSLYKGGMWTMLTSLGSLSSYELLLCSER